MIEQYLILWGDSGSDALTIPYKPDFDSPLERRQDTDCCVWFHLEDGFAIRIEKTGTRLRIYHKTWDASNGPIMDLNKAEDLPKSQEEFDSLLITCQEILEL